MNRLEWSGRASIVSAHQTLTTSNPSKEGHVMAAVDFTIEYRDIPGYPGYRVGNNGLVWTAKVVGGHGKVGDWRLLGQRTDEDGYQRTVLCSAGKRKGFFVHCLVLIAFVGTRPDGMVCRHLRTSKMSGGTERCE